MAFAMARRGDLPRVLEHVHPAHQVPDKAVLVIGGIAAVIAATGTLAAVASTAAFTILVYYGIANIAAIRMPAHAKLYSDVVPAIGLIACTLLALSLDLSVILTGAVVLIAGFVVRTTVQAVR
jgi:APA family basic amino acid/polyamine antiporter